MTTPWDFTGKVAVITGAASGIGRATALAFARNGARVALLDRDHAGLEALATDIEATGGSARYWDLDVSDPARVETTIAGIVADLGHLDIAFNNAGITQGAMPTHETPDETFEQIMGVNVRGVWLGMKAQLRHMVQNGRGSIVNTASTAGVTGSPGLTAYTASKHAVVGLTRAAAIEYAGTGIRINAVAPGTVGTPMVDDFLRQSGDPTALDAVLAAHPMGRAARPGEIADAVLWLSGDQAGFVTGHILMVDGGFSAR